MACFCTRTDRDDKRNDAAISNLTISTDSDAGATAVSSSGPLSLAGGNFGFNVRLNNNRASIQHKLDTIPQVSCNDFVVGETIGSGGSCHVNEIKFLRESQQEDAAAASINDFMKENKRFVVKTLKPTLPPGRKLINSAKSIVNEALTLSALRHENICELRAWTSTQFHGFGCSDCMIRGYYLVFDRLEETLKNRIRTWSSHIESLATNRDPVGAMLDSRDISLQQIKIAIDLSKALEYLHNKRIVHLDVKPQNVGFDQQGTLKLFDFGQATELPPPSTDDPDETFHLKGIVGTGRYMAVEVIRNKPYNCKADVYSFAMTLWEMLAMARPFTNIPQNYVKGCADHGQRPAIPDTWSSEVASLLRSGWAESLAQRPHMSHVRTTLESLLHEVEHGQQGHCHSWVQHKFVSTERKSPATRILDRVFRRGRQT